jgi:hypothetical protein
MADLDLIPLHVVPAIEIPLLRVHVRQLGTAYSIVVVPSNNSSSIQLYTYRLHFQIGDTQKTPKHLIMSALHNTNKGELPSQ